MQVKDRIKKEQFIHYELYSLLSGIDGDIGNVTACVDHDKEDVTAVKVKYFDGHVIFVNVEGDSLAAIVKDVIDKIFFKGAKD